MPNPTRLMLCSLFLVACGGAEGPLVTDAGSIADSGAEDSGAAVDSGVLEVQMDAGVVDAGPPAPTFEADVVEILRFQCQGCHFVTDLPPQIFLEGSEVRGTYDRLVAQAAVRAPLDYVHPGDPDLSYLLHKIEGTHRGAGGQGDRMPPPRAARTVPAEQVATIRAWIEAGAPF